MATTFKAQVFKSDRKQGGKYNAKIVVIHNTKNTKVGTNVNVTLDDVKRPDPKKKTLDIKNQKYIDALEAQVKRWEGYVAAMNGAENGLTVTQLTKYLKQLDKEKFAPEPKKRVFELDFVKFGRDVADGKSSGTARAYHTALNCLERFLKGRTLDVNDITREFLEEFEAFIKAEPALCGNGKDQVSNIGRSKENGRAASQYMACVRHVFNEAKRIHNDEDVNKINITRSPFSYYKMPKLPKEQTRAVELETVQQLINLPEKKPKRGIRPGNFIGQNFARDCFLLSFALAGTNAADLYDCGVDSLVWNKKEKCYIFSYKRKKTRTRRSDEAEIHIRVEPCILPLVEKYRSSRGEKLFCFSQHYATPADFNKALRRGLTQIINNFKLGYFTFYSGRHTWATVGCSDEVDINVYTIHEGLNHVNQDLKITYRYIKKDFAKVWRANAKILAELDWSALLEREKKYVKEVAAEVV